MGSQRSITPKTHASISPSQKIGIDTPTSAHTRARLSRNDLRQTAETMPIGIPTSSASTMAAVASSTVAGKRRRMSGSTGSPRTIEIAESPRRTLPM